MRSRSEYALTKHNQHDLEDAIVDTHLEEVSELVLERAVNELSAHGPLEIETMSSHPHGLAEVLDQHAIDLIVLEYEDKPFRDYWLQADMTIPLWIEWGKFDEITTICTNLAPNRRAPAIAYALARGLQKRLKLYYVVDIEGESQYEARHAAANRFLNQREERYGDVDLTTIRKRGDIDAVTAEIVEKSPHDLFILGRIEKEVRSHFIFTEDFRHRFAKDIQTTLLLIRQKGCGI